MKQCRRCEDGFTMVELIITIAIMAILLGSAVSAFAYISAGNARRSAAKFNSKLSTAQTETMMREKPTYLYLFKDNGVKVILSESDTEDLSSLKGSTDSTKVGGNQVKVIAKKSGGSQELDDSKFIRIAFKKATGAYSYAKFNGDADSEFISEIDFSGKENYKVTLVQLTGKHVMSK